VGPSHRCATPSLRPRALRSFEIVYLKLYQRQMPVIDHAIEMAALMLGTDRRRCGPVSLEQLRDCSPSQYEIAYAIVSFYIAGSLVFAK
jgi:hypothetical protein